MQIRILGCSGGIGGSRRTMSLLVDGRIAIDAGSGLGNLSLEEMERIDHVFLTHSHLDHTGFLPLLADAAAFLRQRPLEVHALAQTITALQENMLNGILWPDYCSKPSPENPYIRFHALVPGESIMLGECRVTALPAAHSVPAVGYAIDSGGESFVYSGDTTLCAGFWHLLNSLIDLRYLMVEVTFREEGREAALSAGHMTPSLLAQGLAYLTKPVQLLIAHIESGQEGKTMDEIAAIVGGIKPIQACEGQIYLLK